MTKCTEAAAREAALVGALERLIVLADKKVDGLQATNYQIYTDAGRQLVDDVRALLADTSPAAAALLAQGERLRERVVVSASMMDAAANQMPDPQGESAAALRHEANTNRAAIAATPEGEKEEKL